MMIRGLSNSQVAPKPWKVLSPMPVSSPTSLIGQTSLPTPVIGQTNGTEGSVDSGSMDALLRQSRIPSAKLQSSAADARVKLTPSIIFVISAE